MQFMSVMGDYGYAQIDSDHCVFVKVFGEDDYIILLLYVDDMLIVEKNMDKIKKLKGQLAVLFTMKDMGHAKQIRGMKIVKDRGEKLSHLSLKKMH